VDGILRKNKIKTERNKQVLRRKEKIGGKDSKRIFESSGIDEIFREMGDTIHCEGEKKVRNEVQRERNSTK